MQAVRLIRKQEEEVEKKEKKCSIMWRKYSLKYLTKDSPRTRLKNYGSTDQSALRTVQPRLKTN